VCSSDLSDGDWADVDARLRDQQRALFALLWKGCPAGAAQR